MAAVVVEIADAVVSALNGASLGQTFTAARGYVPVHQLTDLDGLKVTVVPQRLSLTDLSRYADDHDYVIDVGIQRKIGTGTMTAAQINAACDPLMLFAEKVCDLFRGKALDGYEAASCVGVANDPIFWPPHLDDERVFTSVVSLTFRVARDRP